MNKRMKLEFVEEEMRVHLLKTLPGICMKKTSSSTYLVSISDKIRNIRNF